MNVDLATSFEFQMSAINRAEPEFLEYSINLAIVGLTRSMNQKNSMDGDQIDECAILIIDKYWFIKPEEILLVFKMAKTGEFGTDFNRLDALTIFQWIEIYLAKHRAPHFEKLNQAMKPDALSQEVVLQSYTTLMEQTKQSATNDLRESLKSKNREKSAKDTFTKFYAESYNQQKGQPDFNLARFEAGMDIVKKKMGL